MKLTHLKHYIAVTGLLVAFFGIAHTAPAALHEYNFSGPSLTGRFVVEEYSGPPGVDVWSTTFTGAPYLFSATAGNLTYTADTFQLEVWNKFPAFGISDRYVLFTENMSLGLLGPSLQHPSPSTLPHNLSDYSGRAVFQILDPASGNFVEFQIDTLTPVPEPAPIGLLVAAAVAGVSYQLFRRRWGAGSSMTPLGAAFLSCQWSLIATRASFAIMALILVFQVS